MVINQNLVAFERVVELKTIHAAAESLKLTQVAITKRIQALEQTMGVNLFLRSRRGMALTEEGLALLRYCRVAREAEGELLSAIKGRDRREVAVTVAGPTSAISTRIAQNCLDLYQKFPFLRLNLRSEDHLNLVEMVKRGEADLAVVDPSLVPNEMDSKMLKADRYLLVAPMAWKNRDLKEILERERIIDFYESDQTTYSYLRKFGLEKIPTRNRLFVNENEALVAYLLAGVGFCTLTESVAAPHLESGKIIKLNRGQAMEMPLALCWYPRSQAEPYFSELTRAIK